MESINRSKWIFDKSKSILNDKDYMFKSSLIQMLNKSTRIFKYKNLPDTILEKDLETILQVGGYAIWKRVGEKMYVFSGGLGGQPNPYYLPTIAIVANPALKYNASLEIDKECVVMLNDYHYQGLMPMFNKYCGLLVEAELSLKYAILNTRIPAIVQADNDNTYESAKLFFDKIIKGEEYGIVSTKEFYDGIKIQDYHKVSNIKDLIEAIQYIKGSWYNEIGINAQFNMKREAINEAEATLNDDILIPTIDVMLDCRQKALEKVNEMFGTNITVELASVWKQNRTEEELALEYKEAEIESIEKTDKEESETDETERDTDNSTND